MTLKYVKKIKRAKNATCKQGFNVRSHVTFLQVVKFSIAPVVRLTLGVNKPLLLEVFPVQFG